MRPTASDSSTPVSGTRFLLAQWLCALLAIAIYAPALEGPFVWDDRLLLETPQIAELRPLGEYFRHSFWQVPEEGADAGANQGVYYRPLSTLSLAIDRSLHGDNASGFHLLGLLLHAVNTALVLSLARRLGATLSAAVVGALLFAWFPRLTESVAWISGRTDVLAATFSLLALRLTLGSWPARRWLAAGCVLLGLSSKEVALAAAVGVLFWEWASRAALPSRSRWLGLLPTTVACASYLALRSWALTSSPEPSPIALTTRGLASLEAVARYGIMLVDGWQARLQIGYLAQPDPWLAVLGVCLVPVPFIALRTNRGHKEQLALLLVVFGALGLVLHVVPIQGKVVAADRFLYLPVAVLGVLLAVWLSKARSSITLGAAAVLALSYAPVTWQRASVWGDDIAFWGTAVSERSAALNAHPRLGFGNLLSEHGMYEEALGQYAKCQPADKRSWMLCQYNRSGTLAMNGEFDAAISVLRDAHQRAPNAPQLGRLARLYASDLKADEAREAVREYAAQASDPAQARALEQEVGTILQVMPEVARPRVGLADELAQAREYAELGLYRLAMTKLVGLLSRPGITPGHLQGMLTSALEHGTPEQLQAVIARLDALGVAYPPAYVEVARARMERVARLRKWTRDLERN